MWSVRTVGPHAEAAQRDLGRTLFNGAGAGRGNIPYAIALVTIVLRVLGIF